ncbi:protein of unknown function [Candidatus Nitrosocosmicus franklandus]|uniref:Uncharacterized protein n=1 Tax=Candidatus Nitrosocosmicus franklandianus TaxID=1798806 RepID=A0A484ICT1_9ARCH|nr:protein of unknown function [Candidatus Nitrosocosmicus franklandus]
MQVRNWLENKFKLARILDGNHIILKLNLIAYTNKDTIFSNIGVHLM